MFAVLRRTIRVALFGGGGRSKGGTVIAYLFYNSCLFFLDNIQSVEQIQQSSFCWVPLPCQVLLAAGVNKREAWLSWRLGQGDTTEGPLAALFTRPQLTPPFTFPFCPLWGAWGGEPRHRSNLVFFFFSLFLYVHTAQKWWWQEK